MRISADPENVKSTGLRLGTFADGCESVAGRVHPTDIAGMPPHVAAVVWGRLSGAHRDLQRGRNELQDTSIEARRRAVMMQLAGDGASAAALDEIAAIARESTKYGGMSAMGLAIGGAQLYGRVAGSAPLQIFNQVMGMPRQAADKLDSVGALLKGESRALSRQWGQHALVQRVHRLSNSLKPVTGPLGKFLKPFNVAVTVNKIVSTYQSSSARTVWGRAAETAIRSSGLILTKNPIGALADVVTDGTVSNIGDFIWETAEAAPNPSKWDEYSNRLLEGQFGTPIRHLGEASDWFGYNVLGPAIYGYDPSPPAAGSGGGGGW